MTFLSRICLLLSISVFGITPAWSAPVCPGNLLETTPTADFTLNADGTAVHNTTGLMWKRCAEGQVWDGTTCAIAPATPQDWQTALFLPAFGNFAGFNDWRLPNIKELKSIVESACHTPAINDTVFPMTSADALFWSSSVDSNIPSQAWGINFGTNVSIGPGQGRSGTASKSGAFQVRWVRAGRTFDSYDSLLTNTTTAIGPPTPLESILGNPVEIFFFVNSTGTPTGNVTVTDGVDSCTGTVAAGSCMITFTSTGIKNLVAQYLGDLNNNPSQSSPPRAHLVQPSTETTITNNAPNPSTIGQAVTVDFTVVEKAPGGSGTPTGIVTVTDGVDSCMATVAVGSCVMTFTSAGPKMLKADYAGDVIFGASTSADVPHQVLGNTTTTITGNTPNPSLIGQPVTVNFTVTSPSGTPVGNVTVSDGTDSCTATVAVGTCDITMTTTGAKNLIASYAGSGSFVPSTSAPVVQQVTLIATTTTIDSSNPNPSIFGQPVTVAFSLTAVSGTPVGNVTVSDGTDSCTATVAAGSCLISFTSAGAKSLTASYAGDGTFEPSTSAPFSQQVTMVATVTAISGATPDPSTVGQPVNVSFNVTGAAAGPAPTGIVTVTDGTDTCVAPVSAGSCSITFQSAGTKSLTATYSGDGGYSGSTSSAFSLQTNPAPPSAPAKPIPTLSEWMMIMMSMLLMLVGILKLNRRID